MSWLTPAIAGIAAAIAVPTLLILYFLKLRRRNLEVSTTLLWKKSIKDMQANAPFQKLRRNLLLLLQLLILIAALLALGQPIQFAAQPPGDRVVILIDRSASMSARDESLEGTENLISRLEMAKHEAVIFLDSLNTGGLFSTAAPTQAMIIAFDASAEVVQPYTDNRQLLEAMINGIEPTDGPSNLDQALRLAGAYALPVMEEDVGLRRTAGPPLYLFSDGGIDDLDRLELPPESRLEYTAIGGAATPNIAITAIQTRRAYDNPSDAEVFVGLQSTDRQERVVEVQLSVNGIVSSVRDVAIAAASETEGPAQASVSFKLPRAEGAIVAAEILDADALQSDNIARVVLPPAKKLSVAVVTSGNLFLSAALEGMPLSRLETLSTGQFEDMARAGETDEFDVIILDGWVPQSAPASLDAEPEQTSLPPGSYLILGAAPDLRGLAHDIASESNEPDPAVMIDWAREHPALRHCSLDNLIIAQPLEILASDDVVMLARSSSGPAIIEAAQGAVRAIIVTFDIGATNWWYDVSFVLFMASAVQYLGDIASSLVIEDAQPGETLATRVPQGVDPVILTTPQRERVTLHPASDGRVTFGPVRRTGLYELEWSGPPGPSDEVVGGRALRVIPVNMLNPFESRIERRETLDLPVGSFTAQNVGGDSNGARRSSRELWPYLLMAALTIMMIEWWIYNRRMMI